MTELPGLGCRSLVSGGLLSFMGALDFAGLLIDIGALLLTGLLFDTGE